MKNKNKLDFSYLYDTFSLNSYRGGTDIEVFQVQTVILYNLNFILLNETFSQFVNPRELISNNTKSYIQK